MTREFVMMSEFERQWQTMGLTDQDLRRLQETLLFNPQAGVVMKGTGGLRKLRFAFEGRGKSGSTRIVYVDFVVHEALYLIYAYPKNEQDNLTAAQRNEIKKMIKRIESALDNRR